MNPETGSNTKEVDKKESRDEVIQYSDHPSFNFAIAIAWLVAVCAVLIVIFFWWLNRDTENSLLAKQKEKSSIIAEITSPGNIDIEKRAANFKSAVSALKEAEKEKFDMSKFMTDFYTKITNDVVVTSITVGGDGTVNLNGKTGSYRSVADLAMALKSWSALSAVDIGSVSLQEEKDGTVNVVFAVSAQVDKAGLTAGLTTGTSGTGSTIGSSSSDVSTSATKGGNNAKI